MKYNKLGGTDLMVSHIALGGAAFNEMYGKYGEMRCLDLLKESMNLGINYLETGSWDNQGRSEKAIGKLLEDIPRSSFIIGSKVGLCEKPTKRMYDFSAENTEFAINNTLNLLGLDYVDLLQVHDLSFGPDKSILLNETLPTLERAVRDGKVRYIGLADYDIDYMQEIVEESDVKISTILSYAKSTIVDNRLQHYTEFFKSKGVGVINAAATGMGLLSNTGPQSWHPAGYFAKGICMLASEYCKRQNVELARLAYWFALNQPNIDTNVCDFFDVYQMADTVDVLKNGLSDHEKVVLSEVQTRFFSNGPFQWDYMKLRDYRVNKI